jgi:hypothetical protein
MQVLYERRRFSKERWQAARGERRARLDRVTQRRFRRIVSGRGFLLVPAAALAVHQLRYRIAYGSRADQALAAQGHSYVNSLGPWLALLLSLAAGLLVLRVAHAAAGRADDHPRRSFAGLWALTSASLVAIYVAQELLEGFFAAGHPAGVAGVVGHGGWWALPLAAVAGAVLAALLRAGCALVSAARRLAARARVRLAPAPVRRLRPVELAPWPALARAAAGRAPPAA